MKYGVAVTVPEDSKTNWAEIACCGSAECDLDCNEPGFKRLFYEYKGCWWDKTTEEDNLKAAKAAVERFEAEPEVVKAEVIFG